jgi:formylglycine-generating enzyme required for sulfatase activity
MPHARDANPNRPESDPLVLSDKDRALVLSDKDRALVLSDSVLSSPGQCKDRALESLVGQSLVWVAPGPFLMGSDAARDLQADQREFPQHRVTLPGYWIGCYPVTVAQFRAFVNASGYQPADASSLVGRNNHPATVVTWHDGLAYCRWLSERAGVLVTLPSEAEWEKAARGTDGRIYPWGDEPPDRSRCNFGRHVGKSTPVGRYVPHGLGPYGSADMAGNVWEWTRSLLRRYPYRPDDGREEMEVSNDVLRVLRGGSYLDAAGRVRCAARSWYNPNSRGRCGGLRIVVHPQTAPAEIAG